MTSRMILQTRSGGETSVRETLGSWILGVSVAVEAGKMAGLTRVVAMRGVGVVAVVRKVVRVGVGVDVVEAAVEAVGVVGVGVETVGVGVETVGVVGVGVVGVVVGVGVVKHHASKAPYPPKLPAGRRQKTPAGAKSR